MLADTSLEWSDIRMAMRHTHAIDDAKRSSQSLVMAYCARLFIFWILSG